MGKLFARGAVVVLALAASLVAIQSPANAAAAYVGGNGASGRATWDFVDRDTLGSITLTVTDTACNAEPADITFAVYGQYDQIGYSKRTNYKGCNQSSQTWGLGTISYWTTVVFVQVCVGDFPYTCSSFIDNPRS